jgi:transposase
MTCDSKRKDPSVSDGVQIEGDQACGRGEGVLPVARKLGISRKLLHDWIKAWEAHGPEGLNRKRGPKPGPRRFKPLRLVGRQQLDIDFFRKALRSLERPAAQGKPASASSKSSKP